MRKPYLIVLILTVALVATVYAYAYWPASSGRSVPTLTQQARAGSIEERQAAIIKLAHAGTAGTAEVQRLLAESPEPPIRSTCVRALGDVLCYEAMDALLDALTDPDPETAREADMAVTRMVGANIQVLPDASRSPAENARKRQVWLRNAWKVLKNSPALEQTKARLHQQMENRP